MGGTQKFGGDIGSGCIEEGESMRERHLNSAERGKITSENQF